MKRFIMRRRRRRGDTRRLAGAVVEFAVVLPLLITILFGIIEYGWIFMIRQTLQHAAREGCRTAALQTSTDAQIDQRINEIMATTNVAGYTIAKTHATGPDNPIETVTVSIPYNAVSLLGGYFGPHDYDLVGACSMRKEGIGGVN